MKDHVIEFDAVELSINGEIYPVLMSDADILESVLEIQEEYNTLDKTDPTAIYNAVKHVIEWAAKALGPDALQKISKGRPVNINQAMQIVTAVNEAVTEAYTERVQNEYILPNEAESR